MKLHYDWKHVRSWLHTIIRDMNKDGWKPDYIVGVTRGGLTPATMLSHYLEVPLCSLDVSFRDNGLGPESNLWMAEDAFGRDAEKKNILIVDDINDTGRTLQWIKDDWTSSCLPDDPRWQEIWNGSVRFAVMVNNMSSRFADVDYWGTHVDKQENPCWVVFPWENWWEN